MNSLFTYTCILLENSQIKIIFRFNWLRLYLIIRLICFLYVPDKLNTESIIIIYNYYNNKSGRIMRHVIMENDKIHLNIFIINNFQFPIVNYVMWYFTGIEATELKQRSNVGILLAFPWALGTMAWGGLAYFIRSWRWLNIAASLPSLLFLPCIWWTR